MNCKDKIQIILNIMTIISFIVSGSLGISKLLQKRKKIRVEIKDYTKVYNIVQLYVFITNESTRTVSISSISIGIEIHIKKQKNIAKMPCLGVLSAIFFMILNIP